MLCQRRQFTQNGRHFTYEALKLTLLYDNYCIVIQNLIKIGCQGSD